MELKNKICIVTGGARRIGREICIELAKHNAIVIFTYLKSKDDARDLEKKLNEKTKSISIRCDITKESDIKKTVSLISKKFHSIDVLINNASIYCPTKFDNLNYKQWLKFINTNLNGTFLFSLYCSKIMLKKNVKGKIINISDSNITNPRKNFLPYIVSKYAITGLTIAMAKEVAPHISVNCIAPGPILPPETYNYNYKKIVESTLLKKMGKPQDIVKTIIFLLQNDFITGSVIYIDGGKGGN